MERRQTCNYKMSKIQLWYRAPVKDECEWQLSKCGNAQKGKENSGLSSLPSRNMCSRANGEGRGSAVGRDFPAECRYC